MKHILFTLFAVFTAFNILYSQNASTYFPSSIGYKWYYKNTPLDSNNVPMPNLTTYRIDSFAVISTYKGMTANIVRFKDYMPTLNQNTAFNDTSWYSFSGTNAYQYLTEGLLPDTLNVPVSILNFFRGLQGWYNMYQFNASVGSTYQLFSKDTTILFNSVPVTIRAKASGKRLSDEVVNTVNGSYTAKKFAFTSGLYLVVVILETPLVVAPDTLWIASNSWMVKRFSPSVQINLSSFGYGSMNVPGKIYELTQPVVIRNISSEVPASYSLSQNYPNPFNPATVIRYQITNSKNQKVTLKVFDAVGKEVVTLVNENQSPGEYEVTFDGNKLSSGIYYYNLTAGDFSETKKMMLVK